MKNCASGWRVIRTASEEVSYGLLEVELVLELVARRASRLGERESVADRSERGLAGK